MVLSSLTTGFLPQRCPRQRPQSAYRTARGNTTILLVAALCLATFPSVVAAQAYSVQVVPAQVQQAIRSGAVPAAALQDLFEATATVAEPTTAAASSSSSDAAQEEQQKAQRLQRIRQLRFDRRPSTILRVWSTPADSEDASADADTSLAANEPPAEAQPSVSGDEAPGETPPAAPPGPPVPEFTEDELEQRAFEETLKGLQRHVTLGNWRDVRELLATLSDEESEAAYGKMLADLASAQPAAANAAQRSGSNRRRVEQHAIDSDDVLGLALAAPQELERSKLQQLGGILRKSVTAGTVIESFVDDLQQVVREAPAAPSDSTTEAETETPQDSQATGTAEPRLTARQALRLLVSAGFPLQAEPFLPSLEQATAANDHEGLNLLSQYALALYAEDQQVAHLERAWQVTQAVLAAADVDQLDKDESLTRAVELAPRVSEQLGQEWLESSFTERPERGMEIIATIGARASQGLQTQPFNPDFRLKMLQLQKTAVEALLKAAPERADSWRETLHLLATNWLTEAVFSYQNDTSISRGPIMQRDPYGNIFYVDTGSSRSINSTNGNQGRPVAVGELLKIKPGSEWLAFVTDDVRPRFEMVFAQLHLKVNEEDVALPFIEDLAKSHPDTAQDLVNELIRVWTDNHDPNASRNRTSSYIYMYGYERKAEAIPLTRSKQERNLEELAALVRRLRALPLGELDEKLLAGAFVRCHSTAEVYRLDTLEKVFGPVESMEPATLAELAQRMRSNLNGVWRQPAVQKDKKTNRKQKDIEAEVTRGYAVARNVVEGGLQRYPDDWTLQLAKAALQHDENNYRQEIEKSSSYTKRRQDAFADFAKAAELYAQEAAELDDEKQTTEVYELWFYASLGSCELGNISADRQPDLTQPARIRAAIDALPAEAAKRHLGMFANSLFTRMSAVNPAVKFRYLRTGFEIVGDHPQAHEAKQVYDYYHDLVTEIKLDAVIDGADTVGHTEPFGVFVNLRHTREIERESGGFGRYLQNQNNQSYSYNYGRPTENYRDKFEESVRAALSEQFEVLSITFQSDDVNSRALPEYGWRYTPYAYLLLQARGPEVDKLPPLQLDLDFLDTSGYAVIPIESPAVPLDASQPGPPARPFQGLKLTQTLDERQADDGKLIVEVQATAQGLVPPLDAIIDWESSDFEVATVEDQGLAVSRFDPESEDNVVVSERTWMVSMQARDNLQELPKSFAFGKHKVDGAEVAYQRYVDADLASVEQRVDLESSYGQVQRSRLPWLLIPLAVVVVGGGWWLWRGNAADVESSRWHMPETITPFTVLGLLRDINARASLPDQEREQLQASIAQIEKHYFTPNGVERPDLRSIADRWMQSVSQAPTNGSRLAPK